MTAAPPPPRTSPSPTGGTPLAVTLGGRTLNPHTSVAVIGNPNAGKTTLFNRLTGLRAKTANFPGTTLECHRGLADLDDDHRVTLLDLPGLYGLTSGSPEEVVAAHAIHGELPGWPKPAAAVVVVNATAVARHLYLVSQVREMDLPIVVALNMADVAEREGIDVDPAALSERLGCPVVPVSARTGQGLDDLKHELTRLITGEAAAYPPVPEPIAACSSCSGCPHAARHNWATGVAADSVRGMSERARRIAEAADAVATHPVWGVGLFAVIMAGLFVLIFSTAAIPMDFIDGMFAHLGGAVASALPDNDLASLLVDGIIGGVGGVLVFLPQICILFFLLTLLEDTGYLARAALVMDRLMSKVGLPGRAFVPMLSAHACAIPAIMATRVIDNKRDRLVSILVIPLFTCSARLPVYAMVAALLFIDRPVLGGLMFFGAYSLGIIAALLMAFVLKHTLLPGKARPLVIELPDYRRPSLRVALQTTLDRGLIFLKKAGTVILLITICLWALSTYPKLDESQIPNVATPQDAQRIAQLEQQIASTPPSAEPASAGADPTSVDDPQAELDLLTSKYQVAYSAAGRFGRFVEPVFAPLGFDWQINVGVLSSFAAREVIVSTLAIVYGIGEDAAEEPATLTETLRSQTRPDGSPVFDTATAMSLLVFFVLAMQCLPTQAIARRETGGWRWPIFQVAYMTVLAWTGAFITYQTVSLFT